MDLNHKHQIKFLRENCPAFQKYEQDIIQAVVDNLTAVNLLLEVLAEGRYSHLSGKLREIQEVNENLMTKIREK